MDTVARYESEPAFHLSPQLLVSNSNGLPLPTPSSVKVIEWFEEYAEEFFQTHTELGETLDIAEALAAEVKQFEESTQVRTPPPPPPLRCVPLIFVFFLLSFLSQSL